MPDNYQYKTLNLPNKNEGLFGLGGNPNKNGIGYSGKIIDSSVALFGGSLGQDGSIGQDGAIGATGASGSLPSNIETDGMLYSDGTKWTTLEFPYIINIYIGPHTLNFSQDYKLSYQQQFLDVLPFGHFTSEAYPSGNWGTPSSASGDQVFVSEGGAIKGMAVFECECTDG